MADAPDDNRWGTIFMGPTSDRESTIDKVTEVRQRDLWNRRTEAEYMERVRVKATVRVQAMLDQARAQAEAIRGTARQWAEKVKSECEGLHSQAERVRQEAEMLRAEADELREAARQEGYNVGAEQALLELEEHRNALDDATASVLKTIESQCNSLFDAWRQELVDLTREAVEKATGWILTEERQAILATLLDASVQALSDRRQVLIRVNPQDSDAVNLVIESAKARFPEISSWGVRPDEGISPGGLLVESTYGMVDNRVEIRREVVADVLRHLSLPPGPADDAALSAVAREMEQSGMNALAEDSDARAAELEARLAQEENARLLEQEGLARQESLGEQAPGSEEAPGLGVGLEAAPGTGPEAATRDEAGTYEAGPDEAGPDETGPDETGPLVSGPVEAGPDLAGNLPDDFDFPELRGIELPPDLPPDLAELLQAQGPAQTAELPPAASDGAAFATVPNGAEKPLADEQDEDIPVLNITVGEADPASLAAAAKAQGLAGEGLGNEGPSTEGPDTEDPDTEGPDTEGPDTEGMTRHGA